jgi:DNA-directed RNA polymerase beta subunit
MTPEEKLLRAIFGEKASDVRDTSLRVPPGVQGTVVEVRVFNRHGVEKDERALGIEREEIERLAKDRDDEQAILDRNVYGRLAELLGAARHRRAQGLQEGHQDHPHGARRVSARRSGGCSPRPTTR